MTPETRRRIFQYGVAVDLVILATGVGYLDPAAHALIISSYVGAVALTAWKGGWRAAGFATLASAVFLITLFDISASSIVAFIVVSAAATAIVQWSAAALSGAAPVRTPAPHIEEPEPPP